MPGADVAALVSSHRGDLAAVVRGEVSFAGRTAEVLRRVAAIEADAHPRWVWWRASVDARPGVRHGLTLQRCWDATEAHRLLVGGLSAEPAQVWATAGDLDSAGMPRSPTGDLFDFSATSESGPPGAAVRSDGFLHPDAGTAQWLSTPERLLEWGRTALILLSRQQRQLARVGSRAIATAWSESAAALLCVEMEESGLPVDREVAEELIAESVGPRPTSASHARSILAERDGAVLRHTRSVGVDLRNPAHVKALLARAGVDVLDTRAWRLEPFREAMPLVDALLRWRKAERIATTYGYSWLDAHVGPDDRLRGGWSATDGAAGRMTASNGLHNLPRPLRPAVAAAPGHVLVRADLGQIEPRVLAAVSGDRAFARETASADLYAPVASRLGVDRPTAKIAVLAAMYGQTSGAAGEALKGLQRAYPTAIAYLEAAYEEGVAGRAVRTFGGRRVPMNDQLGARSDGQRAASGRFARNAVVQGAAAELFKAWAATVRLSSADVGAEIVLCLHDELLLHVPRDAAGSTTTVLADALTDAARRWTGGTAVQFVADIRVVHRWSEAKD